MRRKSHSSEGQFLLPGFDPAPQPRHRLFFAVLPDIDIANRIVQLAAFVRRERGLKGKSIDAGRLHVTQYWLGDYLEMPAEELQRACKAASALTLPPFTVKFDRVLSFSGSRRASQQHAVVLKGADGVAGLITLHQALAAAILNVKPSSIATSGFTPHITLLYDTQILAEQIIEPIEFTVREFALIHSYIGQHRYEVIDRWQLASHRTMNTNS